MYEKTSKQRLYELIDLYLSGRIDAWTFCEEYYYCYDLELDSVTLSELEANAFFELSIVAGRFSKFDEDLKDHPGTYFTEEQLRSKIVEVKKRLGEKELSL